VLLQSPPHDIPRHFVIGLLQVNKNPCGFISIEMAKIVVGSLSLTQPLLLYTGLGPVMLDNIGAMPSIMFSLKLRRDKSYKTLKPVIWRRV
jgi:hypothetical protein